MLATADDLVISLCIWYMHIHVNMNEYVKFTHILMYIQVDASSSWRFSHYTFIYLWHDGCVFLLQCVAVRCSALKCLALYCNSHYTFIYLWHDECVVLQWAASVLQCVAMAYSYYPHLPMARWVHFCCSVFKYFALRCSAFKCLAVSCSGVGIIDALQCVAVCCSVLQCVAVCCSVLQCVAVSCSGVGIIFSST